MTKKLSVQNDKGKEVKKTEQSPVHEELYIIVDDVLLMRHRAAGSDVIALIWVPFGELAGVECPSCRQPVLVSEPEPGTTAECDGCGAQVPVPLVSDAETALMATGGREHSIDGTAYFLVNQGPPTGDSEHYCILGGIGSGPVLEDDLESVPVYFSGAAALWLGQRPHRIVCPECGTLVLVDENLSSECDGAVLCPDCDTMVDLQSLYEQRFGVEQGRRIYFQ